MVGLANNWNAIEPMGELKFCGMRASFDGDWRSREAVLIDPLRTAVMTAANSSGVKAARVGFESVGDRRKKRPGRLRRRVR